MSDALDIPMEYLSFEDIRKNRRVVSYDVVRSILQRTEPLSSIPLPTDGSVEAEFNFPDAWNVGLKELDEASLTPATLTLGGEEHTLTKRAALMAISLVGLNDRYAFKSPGHLITPQMNYWVRNEGFGKYKSLTVLTKDSYIASFMGPDYKVVSNLLVLDEIVDFLSREYGIDEVYVDPFIDNNFQYTNFRLIFPERGFSVPTERSGRGKMEDHWHYGINVVNSLAGTTQLQLNGYMLEERTLAGLLPEYSQSGSFTLYSHPETRNDNDLRGWIRSNVHQIMAVLPAEGEMMKDMPNHVLQNKIGPLTLDIFQTMKIHRKVQEGVLDNLAESGDLTAYGVLHAMAKTGSMTDKFKSHIITHIQKAAGSLIHRTEEICEGCGRMHLD